MATVVLAIEKIRLAEKESDTVFVADIGQNQMWAMQHLSLKPGEKFFTSGGLAPMGFAIPCAIGVAFAHPLKKIVCITGDGGFHFALQSLMLISQYNLNISIYVLNNSSLGMITQFQSLYFCGHMAGTTKSGGYYVPDISKIAEAYNLKYKCISDIMNANLHSDTNQICEIKLGELTVVVPKLEYNNELFDMTPHLSSDELLDICRFTPQKIYIVDVILYITSIYNSRSTRIHSTYCSFCKEAA